MMEYLRKCVFKHELDMLDKMVGDSEDKRNYRNRINERFNEYLYDFSNKCIKPFREQEMENGNVSPKDYMELLKVQLEHDQLLGIYMKQNNEEEKFKIIQGRIVLIKKEMEELKQFAK